MSNSFYLPPPDKDKADFFWKYAENDETYLPAKELDHRNLVVVHIKTIGDTLEYCESAWELCICLLHAMLGTVFQSILFLFSPN